VGGQGAEMVVWAGREGGGGGGGGGGEGKDTWDLKNLAPCPRSGRCSSNMIQT
jgi:hypothetical protein